MLSPRQVHLDFHTSEHIADIARDFNPADFAKTVKEAFVSSVTVFARCHHGWLYYLSEKFPELVHPNLINKNLLLEQVEALHAQGIKAPIYITIQWDYHSATTHPEWLIRNKDGSHQGSSFTEPGFYQALCVNTSYFDFLLAQTEEVCQLFADKLDGLFFDIVGIRPCWCSACRKEMKNLGINLNDDEAVRAFAKKVMTRFKNRMTEAVRKHNKDCSIFYNAGHIGPGTKDSADSFSHFELESLPSGSWGYLHFPATARYARKLGKDCLGMTGKFHTEWGDFHSLKNQAALEFECFRMLSFGFASSIGDQMEPTGKLNKATYKLIGKVYEQFAHYEEWARPSKPLVQVGVFTSESYTKEFQVPADLFGANQMLEELAVQFDILDAEMDFSDYELLIVPDSFTVDPAFQQRLDAYVNQGGKVIACHKGGFNPESGEYPQGYGLSFLEDTPKVPEFLVAEGPMAKGLEEGNEYVIYLPGVRVQPTAAEVLIQSNEPYFNRAGDQFCSHRYTPSSKKGANPAVLKNGSIIFFAQPLFSQYRHNAPNWCKTLISNALDLLLPSRYVRHNGPSSLNVSLLEQKDKGRVTLHLLSYIPIRKSASIDIIEEASEITNLKLTVNLPYPIKSASVVPGLDGDKKEVRLSGNELFIPYMKGYTIVELSV